MNEAMADEMVDGAGGLRAGWRPLLDCFAGLGADKLAERAQHLADATRESGRCCDPVPLLLPAAEFAQMEKGLAQRAALLEAVLADAYGSQTLVRQEWLPPALLYANPGFLRPCRAALCGAAATQPRRRLHLYAADLIRGPDRAWRVLADHTAEPASLGLALENRLALARVLPEAVQACPLRHLHPFMDAWRQRLDVLSPACAAALLSPGPGRTEWFEHVALARALSCHLVQAGDLTVRNGALFLKTLRGLTRIGVLVRHLPAAAIDPLELAPDSGGVPGLLAVARLGGVVIVNDPGAGLVEAPGFRAVLPALSQHVLGEPLLLSAAAGETAPSVAPCFAGSGLVARPVVLRLFLLHDGQGWQALPGGIAHVPGEDRVKDVWVAAEENTGAAALVARRVGPPVPHQRDDLPSRVADNFFWLGRYVERFETLARLLRATLERIERPAAVPVMVAELGAASACLVQAGLLHEEEAGLLRLGGTGPLRTALQRAARERLPALLAELARLNGALRPRLTGEMHATISDALEQLREGLAGSAEERLRPTMREALQFTAAVAGLAAENMLRDGGRLFLDLGRRIERGQAVSVSLSALLEPGSGRWQLEAGLQLLLELCDSVVTYRGRYPGVLQAGPVLDLVVAEEGNPRALAFQLAAIGTLLGRVDAATPLVAQAEELLAEARGLAGEELGRLPGRLRRLDAALATLSDEIGRRYFAVVRAARSIGAPT